MFQVGSQQVWYRTSGRLQSSTWHRLDLRPQGLRICQKGKAGSIAPLSILRTASLAALKYSSIVPKAASMVTLSI